MSALNRIREQFRSHDYIPMPTAAAVPASLTITTTGAQLVISAIAAGSGGNSIELTNDDGDGAQPPTITDDGLTVELSSSATSTFQQVADAINSSSELVSAVVVGNGSLNFYTVTSAFSGYLAGGVDAL